MSGSTQGGSGGGGILSSELSGEREGKQGPAQGGRRKRAKSVRQ